MKTKKILALLLACTLTISLASCTTDDGGTTDGGTTDGGTTDGGDTADSGEMVELEFFSLKPETVSVMEELSTKFTEENPGVTINITAVDDAGTVLMTRLSTDDMPDLLNTFPAEEKYKLMFDDGRMTELTNEEFMQNVSPAMLELSQYNGKQYALPMTLSSYGIYYRTDIFADLGIAEPTTYDELIAAAAKIKESGIDAFAMPNKDVGNTAQRLERLIGVLNNNSNDEFEEIKAGTKALEDSETISGFAEMCVELAQYADADHMGLDYETAIADVVNGDAAMMISGTWTLSTFQTGDPDVQVKLMPFPSPLAEAGDPAMVPVNIDTSYSLSADSPYQTEGLKFLEFMSQTENAQTYFELDGNVNFIEGVEFNKEEHMYMKELMDEGNMFLTQVNFWPNGLREEMRPASQQIFLDSEVDSFVQSFGSAIDKLYE